jgi:hypothetical protein
VGCSSSDGYVVATAKSHATLRPGLARKGEGALELLATLPKQRFALGSPHTRLVVVKCFAREHPALVPPQGSPQIRPNEITSKAANGSWSETGVHLYS